MLRGISGKRAELERLHRLADEDHGGLEFPLTKDNIKAVTQALSPSSKNHILQFFGYCLCTLWRLLGADSKNLSISSNAGLPIDLGEMLCSITYSITLSIAVGRRCKKPEAFISLARKIVQEASGFGISDLFPSIKLFHVISGKKAELEKLHQLADEVLEIIIQEHRASYANLKNGEDVKDDLVDVLLNLQYYGGLEFPLTDDNIIAVF
ncbi:hypothetical protein PTKIN_Ptkin11bG0196100 [Pterospermum kingtungense]